MHQCKCVIVKYLGFGLCTVGLSFIRTNIRNGHFAIICFQDCFSSFFANYLICTDPPAVNNDSLFDLGLNKIVKISSILLVIQRDISAFEFMISVLMVL